MARPGRLSLVFASLILLVAPAVIGDNPINFGDPHPGLTEEQLEAFEEGKEEFSEVEEVDEGLGPVFNGRSCAECHSVAAVGGGSTTLETRFGKITNGAFDPLTQFGGSLIQTTGITRADESAHNFKGETVPKAATIVAGRRTTPLFGLGLVDAVPDSAFHTLAAQEAARGDGTAGRVSMVPDPAHGGQSVGKFGWKAQVPNLLVFSADAYLNEMGITSPMFPDENCPSGDCKELKFNPVPAINDDGSGVAAFNDFMTLLGAPPRGLETAETHAGEVVFRTIGCDACHTPTLHTGASEVAALSHKTFHPYSDFLLHDMGSLGDGIVQNTAAGTEMRTAPLWGLRMITSFMHDGRAATVSAAILAHAGQGQGARDRFAALSASDKTKLLAFLDSL